MNTKQQPGRMRRRTRLGAALAISLVLPVVLPLIVAWLLQPVPWTQAGIGSISRVQISVDDRKLRATSVYLVGVHTEQLRRWQYLRLTKDERKSLEHTDGTTSTLFAPSSPLPSAEEQLDDAQSVAAYVAARKASNPASITGTGVQMLSLPGGQGFEIGDVITSLNDQTVSTYLDAIAILEPLREGDTVGAIIENGDHATMVRGPTETLPGFSAITTDTQSKTTPATRALVSEDHKGDSAGLAFALATWEVLSGTPLVPPNTKLVVTGAILPDGRVRQVGQIFEKSRAAQQAGATIMIVPEESVDIARLNAREMVVLGVTSFDDALRKLNHTASNTQKSHGE